MAPAHLRRTAVIVTLVGVVALGLAACKPDGRDLSLTVASPPPTVEAGQTVSFTATLANVGTAPAAESEIAIAVPVGVTPAMSTAGPMVCDSPAYVPELDGMGLSCVFETLDPSEAIDVEISLTGTVAGASGNVALSASSTGGAEPAGGGGAAHVVTFEFAVVPPGLVDLDVDGESFPTPLQNGTTVSSTTWITNRGTEPAPLVTVTQTFPTGFTLGSPTLQRSGGGASGTCSVAGQVATCTTGAQAIEPISAPGDRWKMVVPATPTSDGYYGIAHGASSPASEAAPDPSPNQDTVTGWRGLAYLGFNAPETVALGSTFQVPVSWVGGGFGQYVSGSIPPNLRLDSISGAGPFTLSCAGTGAVSCSALGPFLGDGGAITLNLTAIAVGGPSPLSMFINSEAGSAGGWVLIETVDPAISSDVHPSFEAPSYALTGEPVTIAGEVRTAGPTAHPDVTAQIELPPGAIADRVTWGSAESPCAIAGRTITCAIGAMGGHDQVPVEITLRSFSPGPNAVEVSVSSPTAQDSPDPWPDHLTLTFPVRSPFRDLGVTVTGPAVPTPGVTHETIHTVTNHGSDPATGVGLQVIAPAGYSVYQYATLDPVAPNSTGCSLSGQVLTCGIGTLAGGASQQVRVRTFAGPPGAASYTSTVTGSEPDPDPDEQPNQASLAVNSISPNADVRVVIPTTPSPVVVGTQFALQADITNAGPSKVNAAQAQITAPSGWRIDSVTANTTCTVAPDGLTASCGPRAITTTWSVVVRVTPLSAGLNKTLTVAVSSEHPDPAPSSNTASFRLDALPVEADLGVSSNQFLFGRGGTGTHDIQVRNQGPATATSLVLTGTLPAAATITGISGGGFACTWTAHAFSCTRSSLAAGLTASPILSLSFADVPGPLTYDFSVSSATTEATPNVLPNDVAIEVISSTVFRGFSGTVVDSGGAPVAGASVKFYAEADGFFPSGEVFTGADGSFSIGNMTPKTYRVSVRPPTGSGLPTEWWQNQATRALAAPLTINGTTPSHVLNVILG